MIDNASEKLCPMECKTHHQKYAREGGNKEERYFFCYDNQKVKSDVMVGLVGLYCTVTYREMGTGQICWETGFQADKHTVHMYLAVHKLQGKPIHWYYIVNINTLNTKSLLNSFKKLSNSIYYKLLSGHIYLPR